MYSTGFLVTIAVLFTASLFPVANCDDKNSSSQSDYSSTSSYNYNTVNHATTDGLPEDVTGDSVYLVGKSEWLSPEQESKMLFYSPNTSLGHDCCPSTYEITSPKFARNMEGDMVILYSNDHLRQQFVQISCKEGVVNHRCRFLHTVHSNRSRCVQKYSYSYALVAANETVQPDNSSDTSSMEYAELEYSEQERPFNRTVLNSDAYLLDMIVLRSGCSCVVEDPLPATAPGTEPSVGVRRAKKVRKVTKMKRSTKVPVS